METTTHAPTRHSEPPWDPRRLLTLEGRGVEVASSRSGSCADGGSRFAVAQHLVDDERDADDCQRRRRGESIDSGRYGDQPGGDGCGDGAAPAEAAAYAEAERHVGEEV